MFQYAEARSRRAGRSRNAVLEHFITGILINKTMMTM